MTQAPSKQLNECRGWPAVVAAAVVLLLPKPTRSLYLITEAMISLKVTVIGTVHRARESRAVTPSRIPADGDLHWPQQLAGHVPSYIQWSRYKILL